MPSASLNPFEIRVSFERKVLETWHLPAESQSLRNQGFIRTIGFMSAISSVTGLNPFEIRVSFERGGLISPQAGRLSQSLRNQGFIRTLYAETNPFHCLSSQSLRNQGFIRTDDALQYDLLNPVSIPSKSGFHSNHSDGQRFLAVEFQRIRSNFIRSVVTFL